MYNQYLLSKNRYEFIVLRGKVRAGAKAIRYSMN